jgi:hypothetical protein
MHSGRGCYMEVLLAFNVYNPSSSSGSFLDSSSWDSGSIPGISDTGYIIWFQ